MSLRDVVPLYQPDVCLRAENSEIVAFVTGTFYKHLPLDPLVSHIPTYHDSEDLQATTKSFITEGKTASITVLIFGMKQKWFFLGTIDQWYISWKRGQKQCTRTIKCWGHIGVQKTFAPTIMINTSRYRSMAHCEKYRARLPPMWPKPKDNIAIDTETEAINNCKVTLGYRGLVSLLHGGKT